MRSVFAIAATVAACATSSDAFVSPRPSATNAVGFDRPSSTISTRIYSSLPNSDIDDTDFLPQKSWRQRTLSTLKSSSSKVWKRMDTLQSAGLYDLTDNEGRELVPMKAGFKTNVGLLVAAFLFKWYRARFITKIPVWDRQPQWNMVITSPEQEKTLKAYKCKNCGAIIFIARHREWFFKGGNTECTNCGATGTDNFENVRDEVVDSIDDDYFDYESPLDFVSAAERRKLVKEAGGDEELAKKMAIERAMENDSEQIRVDEEEDGGDVSSSAEKKTKKKKKSDEKKKKKKAPEASKRVVEEDDIFDELDLD